MDTNTLLFKKDVSCVVTAYCNRLTKYHVCYRDILINKKTGHAKKSGDYYALLELAKTLKIVAQEGSEAIYNGSLTDQLVEDIKQLDGIITKQDFASYE